MSSRDEVIRLVRDNGFPDERIDHSIQVADMALQISDHILKEGQSVDKDVVDKGALLHDIGYIRSTGKLIEA